MKKTKFNPYHKPSFCRPKPQEYFDENTIVEEIFNRSEGYLEIGGRRFYVETDLDYDSCYYESDRPSCKCKIVEVYTSKIPNPNFESELDTYKKFKAESKKEVKEWEKQKERWDLEQLKKKELAERKKLAALKKKYESKTPNIK